MSKKTMDKAKTENEDIPDLHLGFEDNGILLDLEIGEKARKVLDVKNLAVKNLATWKTMAHKLRSKISKRFNSQIQKRNDIRVPAPAKLAKKPQTTVVQPQPQNESSESMGQQNSNPMTIIRIVETVPNKNGVGCKSYTAGPLQPTNTTSRDLPKCSQIRPPVIENPLKFNRQSGLLLYQDSNNGSQLQQQGRLIRSVQPNVYSQSFPFNPTLTVVNPLDSVSQKTGSSTLNLNRNTPKPALSSVYMFPRIIGSTSILPATTGPINQNLWFQTKPVQPSQQPTSQQQRMLIQPQPRQAIPPQQLRQTIPQQRRLPVPLRLPISEQPRISEQVQQKLPQHKVPISNQEILSSKQKLFSPNQKTTPVQITVQSQVAAQQFGWQRYLPPRNIAPPVLPASNTFRYSTIESKSTHNSGINSIKTSLKTGGTIENGNDGTDDSKTFPSLVVLVKPCLMNKQRQFSFNAARAELDTKLKSLISCNPQKLTEWLMQRRLLSLDLKCTIHFGGDNQPCAYKLGLYSNNIHPDSGGYVWVAECCGREKEVSVFQGSIFAASIYPPGTLLKLIYHWACQTSFSNVIQWVKVTNYYLKNFYTLLRSVCVAGLHRMCPVMGGPDKYVEIAIVTLGTSKLGSTSTKPVKVDILGVFDPVKKIIRMKVINPYNDEGIRGSASQAKKMLQPLGHWINKNSVLLIDGVIDKFILEKMGFKKIIQSSSSTTNPPGTGKSKPAMPTNLNATNYLRHVVPKMFQSTLCVLSKSLIQQFLDELSWREIWGGNPLTTFENVLNQLAEMTKWETGESLINRLNQISLDPFEEPPPKNLLHEIDLISPNINITGRNDVSLSMLSNPMAPKEDNVSLRKQMCPSPTSKSQSSANDAPARNNYHGSGLKRKFSTDLTQFLALEPKNIVIQSYYYGTVKGNIKIATGEYGGNLNCPLCLKKLVTSQDIMAHIYQEGIVSGGSKRLKESCTYCLKDFSSKESLASHELNVHTMSADRYCCRICQLSFVSEATWIIHMWENHEELEMPYICDLCGFRSSMHPDVIDHFHKEHANCDHVICPICMKTFSIKTSNCIKQIVIHALSHNSSQVLKCPQCALVFPTVNEYRSHVAIDGAHRKCPSKGSQRYVPSFFETVTYMPKPPTVPTDKFEVSPPSKKLKLSESATLLKRTSLNRNFTTPIDPNGTFTMTPFNLDFLCDDNTTCLECNQDLKIDGHFAGFMKCNKCPFATCCGCAMTNHHASCHSETGSKKLTPGLKLNVVKRLDLPLKCICGFSSTNPYRIAEHLVQCDQSTAYSS